VYLREVAAALDGREEIGDGFVARVCAEVQRRLWLSAIARLSAELPSGFTDRLFG
jgi:hypothetical protein